MHSTGLAGENYNFNFISHQRQSGSFLAYLRILLERFLSFNHKRITRFATVNFTLVLSESKASAQLD